MDRKKLVEYLLEEAIERHENNQCECNNNTGMCFAGQYVESVITVDEVLETLGASSASK